MRLLHTIIFYSMLALSYIIGTIITVLISSFDAPEIRMEKFQRSAHIWAKFLAFVSGIPVKTFGLENIPKDDAVILASNHQGTADVLILLACLPVGFIFIIKKELFKVPFFGWYLKQAGYVSLERGTTKGAFSMFSDAEKLLRSGSSILIFPEGTRSPDGHLHPFKRGSLLLAFKARVKVVPIAISGSYNILPKKSIIINPIPVKLKVGEPISLEKFGSDYNKANDELYNIIKSMLER